MSDREILLRWLASAATRLRWNRRVRELGWFACAIVALLLLTEVLAAVGAPKAVISALIPLLLLTALAALALLIVRLVRPTTLAQAAGAADSRAQLKDELKSAHWFAQRSERDAFVDLLLARAAHTAQRLDASRLFPLRLPRSVLAALVLAIVTGTLSWLSPRIALSFIHESASASVGHVPARDARSAANRSDSSVVELPAPDTAAKQDPSAAPVQLESMTNELPPGTQDAALQRESDAEDTRLVARLLHALGRKHPDEARVDSAARPQDHAPTAQRNLDERPESASNEDDKAAREPQANARTEQTTRVRQQLRAQSREERRKLEGAPAQGDVTENNRLQAIARNNANMRKVAYGEGEAAQAGSQTSVSGAATGARTGRSRSGGSEGEHPQNGPSGDADAEPVIGQRTARLQGQVQKTRMDRNDPQDIEEAFYAATQRQASQVESQNSTTQWQAQREAALPSGAIPPSYREGVKRYFLIQHDKDDQ